MKVFDYQIAGNIHDDSMSVELLEGDAIVADITRFDGSKDLEINIFGNDIDLEVIEEFISFGRLKLEPFEDGSALATARRTQRFTKE